MTEPVAPLIGKIANLQVTESESAPADTVVLVGDNASFELDLTEIRKLKKILSQAEELLIARQQQIAKAKNLELPF